MYRTKLYLSLALMFMLLVSLAALPEEIKNLPLQNDPNLLTGRLENGLTYYIMRNAKPQNRAELRLFVNVGSVSEDEDQRGLAHFTEHMVFNGTKNFPKSQMIEYLTSIGMGYQNGLNGGTSYDYTMYMFRVPTDNEEQLRKGLMILSDMAHQVSFEAEEIERERGVIIEEWRMGQDAQSRISEAQNAVRFAGSRYAERSPIGTYEVLSTFEHDTIRRFYHDWYRPDLQSVVVIGDFEPQMMQSLVQEYFGVIPARENPRPLERFPIPENLSPQVVVTPDPEFPMHVLSVMWKKPVYPLALGQDFYEYIKQNLFYTMLNTRLDEYSRQADPPFSYVGAYEFPLLRSLSAANVFALLTQGKGKTALTTILTETERVQRYGFLPSEFERAKLDLLRRTEQALAEKDTRESDDIVWELFYSILHDYVYLGPEQEAVLIESLIGSVTLEEVNAIVHQMIPEKNMFISITGPEKPGLVYPTEEELLGIALTIADAEIEPYEDKTVDQPLISQIPAPGRITKQSRDKRSGIRIWKLSNGVTVYSKKTDFKNDEVLLSAFSPGGYAQFPEDHMAAGRMLSWFISEAGFGEFDATSLQKATVGKVANVEFSLDLHYEGIDASCSPKDMELMFQMLYRYVTDPRFEAENFASFIQRGKSFYQDRMLDPQTVFFDRMNSAVYADHPYRKSLTGEDVEAISLPQLEHIFRDRYADFSDFSFVIVGNFDEARLQELVCTYLANLPVARRKDKIKDVGIRAVQGRQEMRFHKGSERSFVALITNGRYPDKKDSGVQLAAMLNILNEKLRENIREQLSGVYFVQAWQSIEQHPKPSYVIQTVMACSPTRVDELSAAIIATMDSLKAGLLDDRYIEAAKTTMQKRYEVSIKTNSYWLYRTVNSIRNRKPLDELLNYPKYYDKIDKKTIVKAANQYLIYDRNQLTLIMLPEETKD